MTTSTILAGDTGVTANHLGSAPVFEAGVIYRAIEGPYDDKHPEFDCYKPVRTHTGWLCECWVCDKSGRIHPCFAMRPIAVQAKFLGEVVSRGGVPTENFVG